VPIHLIFVIAVLTLIDHLFRAIDGIDAIGAEETVRVGVIVIWGKCLIWCSALTATILGQSFSPILLQFFQVCLSRLVPIRRLALGADGRLLCFAFEDSRNPLVSTPKALESFDLELDSIGHRLYLHRL
jgi:hypothetical protein